MKEKFLTLRFQIFTSFLLRLKGHQHKIYGLNAKCLALAKPNTQELTVVMHKGTERKDFFLRAQIMLLGIQGGGKKKSPLNLIRLQTLCSRKNETFTA